jgi:hypothetical protein
MRGPVGFSTLGMRIQNEQSGASSLFAQPMTIEPVPLQTETQALEGADGVLAPAKIGRGVLEARMETALAALNEDAGAASATLRQGHLALLKRWYYRPEGKRAGEIFFPDAEGRWPVKAMLRGVGRVMAGRFKPVSE